MIDPSLLPALYDALIVAQTSSVGEAARRLHKTPSAVSQQLRRIEDRYGVKLFEKAGRRVRPSPAGEAALGAMTRLFAEHVPLRFEITTTNSAAATRLVGQAQVDLAIVSADREAGPEEIPLLR